MINDEQDYKSKSQLKREMHALQDLGIRLTKLKAEQLANLPLTDALQSALTDFPKHHKHEARRRQLQFIGKLMTNQDIDAITQFLAQLDNQSYAQKQQLHQLESLRTKLLTEGNTAIDLLVAQNHAVDRNYLRKLVRQAKKEEQAKSPPIAMRKLFQYLKELQIKDT